MSNMMRTAAAWLDSQRKLYLSDTVTYTHFNGNQETIVSVNATRGRTIFRAENQYGTTIRIHSEDFLISGSDLSFVPARGDKIVCDGKNFEVLAPNDEPVWRWSGSGKEIYRIHTKFIGDVNV